MTHFYKLGQQQALMELGLLKAAQGTTGSTSHGTRPPNAPPPAQVPKPSPPKPGNPPLIGQGQRKTLRNEGVFGM
jgi:hypothetical protein